MRVLVLGEQPSALGGKSPSLKRLYGWLDQLGLTIVSFDNVKRNHYLWDYVKTYDKVITLGLVADKELRICRVNHFALPHPSGLNRQMNDAEYVKKALNDCKEYLCHK